MSKISFRSGFFSKKDKLAILENFEIGDELPKSFLSELNFYLGNFDFEKIVNSGDIHLLNKLVSQFSSLLNSTKALSLYRENAFQKFSLNIKEGTCKEVFDEIFEELKVLAYLKEVKIKPGSMPEELFYFDNQVIKTIFNIILYYAIKESDLKKEVKIGFNVLINELIEESKVIKNSDYLTFSVSFETENKEFANLFYLSKDFSEGKFPFLSENKMRQAFCEAQTICLAMSGFFTIETLHSNKVCLSFSVPCEKKAYNPIDFDTKILEKSLINDQNNFIEQEIICDQNLPTEVEPAEFDSLEINSNFGHEKQRILLVDDMLEIRKYINLHLEDYFEIVQGTSYFDAIELLERYHFDLICCDLYMPEKSGFDLLLYVKKSRKFKDIPFVILTANNQDKQQVLALQHGVDDFIQKPISMDVLRWRIKNIIQSKLETSNASIPDYIEVSEDEKFLNNMVDIIENNIGNINLNVDLIAEEMGMSRATFYRKSEGILKTSPSAFMRSYILKRGAVMLKNSGKNISQIAYALGYTNPKYFTRGFQKEFGISPKEFLNSTD